MSDDDTDPVAEAWLKFSEVLESHGFDELAEDTRDIGNTIQDGEYGE